jgi:predicted negative regulator of RcsB-dependent stress response
MMKTTTFYEKVLGSNFEYYAQQETLDGKANPVFYQVRGDKRIATGDVEGACADYQKALDVHSQENDTYHCELLMEVLTELINI